MQGGGLLDKLHTIDYEKDEPMPTEGDDEDTGFIQGLKDKWSKYREEYDKKQGPAKEGLKGYFINEKAIEEAGDISNRKKFDSGGLASLKKIDMSMFEKSEPMPTEGDDEDTGFIQGLKDKWEKYKEERNKKQGPRKPGLKGAYDDPKNTYKLLDEIGDINVKKKAAGGLMSESLEEMKARVAAYDRYMTNYGTSALSEGFDVGKKEDKPTEKFRYFTDEGSGYGTYDEYHNARYNDLNKALVRDPGAFGVDYSVKKEKVKATPKATTKTEQSKSTESDVDAVNRMLSARKEQQEAEAKIKQDKYAMGEMSGYAKESSGRNDLRWNSREPVTEYQKTESDLFDYINYQNAL
jgi:hypothetical protein